MQQLWFTEITITELFVAAIVMDMIVKHDCSIFYLLSDITGIF